MLNRITIMGRLTRDPEKTVFENDIAKARFSIACEQDFKSKSGKREVDFVDVVAWRSTADFVYSYFKKGSMVLVDGRLSIRTWVDSEGEKHRTTEIVAERVYFGESKAAGSDAPTADEDVETLAAEEDVPF